MFELRQSICYPGSGTGINEDIIGYGRHYCFVMDGASCLSGKNVVDPISDSAWMVKKVRDGLCALLDNQDPRPTGQLLQQVVAQVREEYVQALQGQGVDTPDDSPSAGMALFRQRNGKLEFFGLGDCVGTAELADGAQFYSLDQSLPDLDHQVLEQMQKIHRQTGISVLEARKTCNDLLVQNRKLRNKPGGYWIVDLLSDDGIRNAREKTWELTQPVCVGAFSDGFSQLTEAFRKYRDYTDLFKAMQTNDLEEMCRHLCALQEADPYCNQYPRFKLRDDTCALWGYFHPDNA